MLAPCQLVLWVSWNTKGPMLAIRSSPAVGDSSGTCLALAHPGRGDGRP